MTYHIVFVGWLSVRHRLSVSWSSVGWSGVRPAVSGRSSVSWGGVRLGLMDLDVEEVAVFVGDVLVDADAAVRKVDGPVSVHGVVVDVLAAGLDVAVVIIDGVVVVDDLFLFPITR